MGDKSSDKKDNNSAKGIFTRYKRLTYFIATLLLFVCLIFLLKPVIYSAFQNVPLFNNIYSYVMNQLSIQSYVWLLLAAIVASFFLSIFPSDFVFIYYIVSGANIWISSLVFFVGLSIGRIINYWVGYLFSGFVTKHIIRENHEKFNKKFSTLGNSFLVLGNLFPFFPADIFALFLGTIKYSFWKFLIYNSIGKILRILIILVFLLYLKDHLTVFTNIPVYDFFRNIMQLIIGF